MQFHIVSDCGKNNTTICLLHILVSKLLEMKFSAVTHILGTKPEDGIIFYFLDSFFRVSIIY